MNKIPSWRTDKRKTVERGYNGRWQKERLIFLAANPLCSMCYARRPPRIVSATTVDHRIPHRGDMVAFWDRNNWQALCTSCHNGDKQAMEKSGRAPQRIGLDGFPVEQDDADVGAHPGAQAMPYRVA